jgi:hypothetical protein
LQGLPSSDSGSTRNAAPARAGDTLELRQQTGRAGTPDDAQCGASWQFISGGALQKGRSQANSGPVSKPLRRRLLAEAVEELRAEGQARNNGIGIVARVIQYCVSGWPDESLLRGAQ